MPQKTDAIVGSIAIDAPACGLYHLEDAADAIPMRQPISPLSNNKLKFMMKSWDMHRVQRGRHSFLQIYHTFCMIEFRCNE